MYRVFVCFFACVVLAENRFDALDGYKGRYGREPAHYEVVVPQKVTKDGEFISHMIPHHYSSSYYKHRRKTEMKPEDAIHYMVPIAGIDHHLELIPSSTMISPGMVVETHDEKGIKKRKMRRSDDTQCHFSGAVKGVRNSRVAVSTCYGLSGYIRTKRGHFIIEPADGHDVYADKEHPHLVYQHEVEYEETEPNCQTKPKPEQLLRKRGCCPVCGTDQVEELDVNGVSELHIETMVALDHSFLRYHKLMDIENYVLTVFNMAHAIYHESTLGFNVNLAIVRLIRLEHEDHEMNTAVTKNASRTLEYFRDWQNKINPAEDSHPNHHDVAVLLTRIDICGDNNTCGVVGASQFQGICDPVHQAALCEDVGLRLGFIIAHEIGHSLGIPHDSKAESGCLGVTKYGWVTVMNPVVSIKIMQWSRCSRRFLSVFINSGRGKCLYDPPIEHSFDRADILPGVMYDGEFQCRELLGPNAAICDTGLECDNLICYVEDMGCVETHEPPAPGTPCGEKMWCYGGKCLEVGRRPGSIDGGWSEWTEWSECSRTCGSGVSYQERHCDNPTPRLGGKYCDGDKRRHRICAVEPCDPHQPSYRDVQCSDFDDWVYPEDGKLHTWRSYKMPDENPCVLFCENDEGSVASLKPRVNDGTACNTGLRDVCINGLCREVPCDLMIESTAVEDACGVCHGDGTSCELFEGSTFFFKPPLNETDTTDMEKLITLPFGAVNVNIEEMEPTDSKILLKSADSRKVYISGCTLGIFKIPGGRAWIGIVRSKQERLEIPGPLQQPLSVWIELAENTTIRYSYGVRSNTTRTPHFSWEYLGWTKCSAVCGPGIETSVAKCVEKVSGQVDDKYCSNSIQPKEQVRPCELLPCIPRWAVGDWQDCNCKTRRRYRLVKCVKPMGEGEGESDVISNSFCAGPVPKDKEHCLCDDDKRLESKRDADDLERFEQEMDKYSETTEANSYQGNETDYHRGETIIDKDNIEDVKLTIHLDVDENGYPRSLPHFMGQNSSTSTIALRGYDAIKFLNMMQKDFRNNKNRI